MSLGIHAQSYEEKEFKARFDDLKYFYEPRKLWFSEEGVLEERDTADAIQQVLSTMLDELFQDGQIQSIPEKLFTEPCPLYSQMVGGETEQQVEPIEQSISRYHYLI